MRGPLVLLVIMAVVAAIALVSVGTQQVPRTDSMTLLTVADDPGRDGGTADVTLTIRPGTGSIFIDSFPLTRLDTQSSTRYANQIACDMLQEDCSQYDFFYTIRAQSAIVGGPSAGAAIAVLTAAVLDGQQLRRDIALTGTINSGGIIGPVGGIEEKVEGARVAGLRTVLIPSFSQLNFSNATNASVLLADPVSMIVGQLSDENITVTRVATIEEALLAFTGKNYSRISAPIAIPEEYTSRMQKISKDMCDRTRDLRHTLETAGIAYNDSNNYTQRIDTLSEQHAYSKASLCFSSNIEISTLLFEEQSSLSRRRTLALLLEERRTLERETSDREIATITDLETSAIVRERIVEAHELLRDMNRTDPEAAPLAYAQERLISARMWSSFFDMPGQRVDLDEAHLRRACLAKIEEADERVNYVKLYESSLVVGAQEALAEAQRLAQDEPILCIFTASKAKAQANLVASALFLPEEQLGPLIEQKLQADALVLAKQQQKGFFPILGYSYTQYARDLAQAQPYSALTFSEYALELSGLDAYFPREEQSSPAPARRAEIALFALGAIFGIAATLLLVLVRSKKALKGPSDARRRTVPSREKR